MGFGHTTDKNKIIKTYIVGIFGTVTFTWVARCYAVKIKNFPQTFTFI